MLSRFINLAIRLETKIELTSDIESRRSKIEQNLNYLCFLVYIRNVIISQNDTSFFLSSVLTPSKGHQDKIL